jgi:predicted nucleotidyltransferase
MEKFTKILSSFHIKDELNPEIWTNPDSPSDTKMKEEIRLQLIEIADKFIEFLGYDIFVQDITMTGSLANYNWSEYSDIDLHIMYDYKESGPEEELFKDLFKLKKTLFNSTHDITVKGYEVELYVQDTNEPHYSTGVYSVLYNEWIEEPEQENVSIDTDVIKGKVEQWQDMIDTVIEDVEEGDEDLESSIEKIDKLKDKIKKYRQCGLEDEGEYSYENLVFKFLRRNGYIQKLFDFQNDLLDKSLSLSE